MDRHCATTLRPARAADGLVMARMSRDLIEVGLPWRYTPSRMAALLADRETAAVVACAGDQVQGFALMQFGDDSAHLMLLAVRPAVQRSGIGVSLLAWLETSARVAGITSIGLELRADNAGAFAFYKLMGFEEETLLPGYYSRDIGARRMRRELRPGH